MITETTKIRQRNKKNSLPKKTELFTKTINLKGEARIIAEELISTKRGINFSEEVSKALILAYSVRDDFEALQKKAKIEFRLRRRSELLNKIRLLVREREILEEELQNLGVVDYE